MSRKKKPYDNDTHKHAIETLNREFFLAPVGGKVPIWREFTDIHTGKRRLHPYSESDFRRLYLDWKITVTIGHEQKKIPVSDLWMHHKRRRKYENGVVFAPNLTRDEGLGYYNLFRGFRVVAREGDCTPFLEFVHKVICNGDDEAYDYLINYLAHLFQRPGELPGTAIVLQGEEGIGKGFFVRQIGELVHPYFLHLTDSSTLTNRFNDILYGNLLLFADETTVADNKQAVNLLKGMITEPILLVERKYGARFEVANFMRIMIASNDAHVIQASATDRRFLVLRVNNQNRNDKAYFSQLDAFMKDGGRQALMHFLLHRDLRGVNLGAVPQTKGLREQKEHSMPSTHKWWRDRLMSGELPANSGVWPAWIAKSAVFKDFSRYENRSGERNRSDETRHGIFMREMFGEHFRDGKQTQSDGRRPNGYWLPDLATCRSLFDESMHITSDWPDVS